MPIAFSSVVVSAGEDLEHAVAQINDADLRSEDKIAIRVTIALWQALLSGAPHVREVVLSQVELIRRRAKNFDVIVFPDGQDVTFHHNTNTTLDLRPRMLISSSAPEIFFSPVIADIFSELRHEDLSEVIKVSLPRCVICSSSNHHFCLPSGAHSSQFVRLAEAFTNITIVDRIAYWAALHILERHTSILNTDPVCIVVDNPSMLVLSARIQKILGPAVELHSLNSYPSCVDSNRSIIDLLSDLNQRAEKIYLIIGISSIGGLSKFINDRSYSNVEVFTLFSLSSASGVNFFCKPEIDGYEIYASEDGCSLCQAGSTPVAIHGSTYMAGHTPASPVPLKPSLFTSQKEFIERYGQHPGVLRVHYDDPNESTPRHHSFYIDVASLFLIDEFQSDIANFIENLPQKPDIIISPKHNAGVLIGNFLADILNCKYYAIEPPLHDSKDDFIATISNAKNILVVDDIFITGSRLDSFNRAFREESTLCKNVQNIFYLALLATPPSEKSLSQRLRGLTSGHSWNSTVNFLYKVILPNWHLPTDCPWCLEQKVLNNLIEQEDLLDTPLDERMVDLLDKKSGLQESCFSTYPDSNAVPSLGSESVILTKNSTPLQVLFSCASALQQSRTSEETPLEPNAFPVPRYLAKRVFSDNYTERMIWLALLRSAKTSELEPELKKYFLETISARNTEPQYIMREIALAWLTGKFGSIEDTEDTQNFFTSCGFKWSAIIASGYVKAKLQSVS
ncbi:phosphoribosyltransferase [Pseudomonas sediminis]|uniref:Phosphoribosyltransferase domain-containing protein n=1 Tax=Pseudomonas sediminis TaxID=1691904 RepID=A0ABX6SK37_9PSED|nr:phosphoribosyltransferase [Pseudomonas sediminis]QNH01988.1 hypothetical protein HNQ25_04410 [Pseudomonas sediminis]